jgi:hypothetical protein
MAMTVRTAVLVTLAACLALGLALLPPSRSRPRESRELAAWSRVVADRHTPARETRRLEEARGELRRAELVLAGLELRDSLLARGRATTRPPVVFLGDWRGRAAAAQRSADSAFAPVVSGNMAVGLLPEVNPLRAQRVAALPLAALPVWVANLLALGEPIPCIALLAVPLPADPSRWTAVLQQRFSRQAPANLLGPCGLVAQLGPPGPGVATWLAGGGAVYGRYPSEGDHLGNAGHRIYDAGAYGGWDLEAVVAGNYQLPWLIAALAMGGITWHYPGRPFEGESTLLQNCQRGRSGRCEALLRTPLGLGFRTFTSADYTVLIFRFWQAGDPAYRLVAQLRHEVGADRFQAFWRSRAPVDSAFATAFGVTMDQWMRAWVRRTYGPPRYDPSLGAGDVAGTLAVSVVLVAMVAGFGMRRRVDL